MAAYKFSCSKCGQTLETDESLAGQTVQCPKCQQIFNAPPVATAMAAPAASAKTATGAIWSLVLGILGVLFCTVGLIWGIPAVICGHMARTKIRKANGALAGEGMALAGLILGYVAIGLTVFLLPLQLAIAIPSFIKAKKSAQQSACINNLRLIDHAKQQFATANMTVTDSYAPAMSELAPYLMNGSAPVCRDGGVYSVNSITSNPTCTKSGHRLSFDQP